MDNMKKVIFNSSFPLLTCSGRTMIRFHMLFLTYEILINLWWIPLNYQINTHIKQIFILSFLEVTLNNKLTLQYETNYIFGGGCSLPFIKTLVLFDSVAETKII